MSTDPAVTTSDTHPSTEELHLIYQQLCTNYQNLIDFRLKLMGFLPFVTASSFAVTIISDPAKRQALANLVLPFGLLGALITLGLFLYEVENLKLSTAIEAEGMKLEQEMHILGPFAPKHPHLFNAHNSLALIFSTTFAGWICLALWFTLPGIAIYVTLAFFVVGIVLSQPFLHRTRERVFQESQKQDEQRLAVQV